MTGEKEKELYKIPSNFMSKDKRKIKFLNEISYYLSLFIDEKLLYVDGKEKIVYNEDGVKEKMKENLYLKRKEICTNIIDLITLCSDFYFFLSKSNGTANDNEKNPLFKILVRDEKEKEEDKKKLDYIVYSFTETRRDYEVFKNYLNLGKEGEITNPTNWREFRNCCIHNPLYNRHLFEDKYFKETIYFFLTDFLDFIGKIYDIGLLKEKSFDKNSLYHNFVECFYENSRKLIIRKRIINKKEEVENEVRKTPILIIKKKIKRFKKLLKTI